MQIRRKLSIQKLSVQKLPQIYKSKKNKIVQQSKEFQRLYDLNERKQSINYKNTIRSTSQDHFFSSKSSISPNTKDKYLSKKLSPINEIVRIAKQDKQKSMKSTIFRMNLLELAQYNQGIKEDKSLKMIEIEKQKQRQTFPFYQSLKQTIELPFDIISEQNNFVTIRLINGFQKQVNKSSLFPNKKSQGIQKVLQKPFISTKINLFYFENIVDNVFSKKKIDSHVRNFICSELLTNYHQSIQVFQKKYYHNQWKQRKIQMPRKRKIQRNLKVSLEINFICSAKLDFLSIFTISKNRYISILVECYNIIRILGQFQHFKMLNYINNTQQYMKIENIQTLIRNLFLDNHGKIELIIFKIQQQIKYIEFILYRDIQYVIKLNPRLTDIDYKNYVKEFIITFSKHLGIITRSVMTNCINLQLISIINNFQHFLKVETISLKKFGLPNTLFYNNLYVVNAPFRLPEDNNVIIHNPGFINIQFTFKKSRKKKYKNIYRFILNCRSKIRSYESIFVINSEHKINYQKSTEIVQRAIIDPLKDYIRLISQSDNINGCITNLKIDLNLQYQINKFQTDIFEMTNKIQIDLIYKYANYFELWEFYFMDKLYLDDILYLYKRINCIKAIQEEMLALQADLKLINSFPDIIQYKLIRIKITSIKQKIIETILICKKQILKASQQTLLKLLTYGYEQTLKAKKLNQIIPYTTLAEYLTFVNLLNSRQVERALQKIASNMEIMNSNMKFLEQNHYQLRFSMISSYLQSGTWISILRKASIENKRKLKLDPIKFIQGIKQIENKIYTKYAKILKQIVNLMKICQLSQWQKYSSMANDIELQIHQICSMANEIIKQQKLLNIEYFPQETEIIVPQKFYKIDLTFFFEEELFLQKYTYFWDYIKKFNNFMIQEVTKPLLDVDGVAIIQLLRLGQQMITQIKLTTLNKRILQLTDEINIELQPYIKLIKLFYFVGVGSLSYRIAVLTNINSQLTEEFKRKDIYTILPKDTFKWQMNRIQWGNIYKLKQKEQIKLSIIDKIRSFSQVLKNTEIVMYKIGLTENLPTYELLVPNLQLLKITEYYITVLEFSKSQHNNLFLNDTQTTPEDTFLAETIKKMRIFENSMLKMWAVYPKLIQLYSWFEFIIKKIIIVTRDETYMYSYKIFKHLIQDYSHRSSIILKLSYGTIYDDKVRINYDEQIRKMKQFEIRIYNQLLKPVIQNNRNKKNIKIIYSIINQICRQKFNLNLNKLLQNYCKNIKTILQFNSQQNQYYIVAIQCISHYNQKIQLGIKQKVYICFISNEILQSHFGVLKLVSRIQTLFKRVIHLQTSSILHLVSESHYKTKIIFELYLSIDKLLLQSLLFCIRLCFYMDLSMVWDRKFDLNLLAQLLEQNIEFPYETKEKQNMIFVQTISVVLKDCFKVIKWLQIYDNPPKSRIQQFKLMKQNVYRLIPKMCIIGYSFESARKWMHQIKSDRQEEFILITHENPSLLSLNLPDLEQFRCQPKQIQHKDTIKGIITLIEKTNNIILRQIQIRANIQVNKAEAVCFNFGWQSNQLIRNKQYSISRQYATTLLMYCRIYDRIFVTNMHPQSDLLGVYFSIVNCNIINYDFLDQNLHENVCFVCNSLQQLSKLVKIISSTSQSHRYLYVQYSQLNGHDIAITKIKQKCVVYNYHQENINGILKEQLSLLQTQIIPHLIRNQNTSFNVLPYEDKSGQVVIAHNRMRNNIQGKKRQQIAEKLWQYNKQHRLCPQISEFHIQCLFQPIYALKNHQNLLQMHEIASKMQKQQRIQMYIIPCYAMTPEILFGNIQKNINSQKNSHKIKNKQQSEARFKPNQNKGILQEVIQIIQGNEKRNILQQYRLRLSNSINRSWFVLDLSIQNKVSKQVYRWVQASLKMGFYGFYHKKICTYAVHHPENQHKLILLLSTEKMDHIPSHISSFPILNQFLPFDPHRYFCENLNLTLQQCSPQFSKLISLQSLSKHFKNIMTIIGHDKFIKKTTKMIMAILHIMINEIRKLRIALGMYNQSNASLNTFRYNLFGASDLKQKHKPSNQGILELQQVQKKLENSRKNIYKFLSSDKDINQKRSLRKSTYQSFKKECQILQKGKSEKFPTMQHMLSLLVYSVYYSIILSDDCDREQLSQLLYTYTGKRQLYRFCYHIQSGRWEEWQQIKVQLNLSCCSPHMDQQILSPQQILRLNTVNRLTSVRSFCDNLFGPAQIKLNTFKGAQNHFATLFTIYHIDFGLLNTTKNDETYPYNCIYNELLNQTKQINKMNEPIQHVPQTDNKKIKKNLLTFYQTVGGEEQLHFCKIVSAQQFESKANQLKPFLDYKIYNYKGERKKHRWSKTVNSSLIVTIKNDKNTFLQNLITIKVRQEPEYYQPRKVLNTMIPNFVNNSKQFTQVGILSYKIFQNTKMIILLQNIIKMKSKMPFQTEQLFGLTLQNIPTNQQNTQLLNIIEQIKINQIRQRKDAKYCLELQQGYKKFNLKVKYLCEKMIVIQGQIQDKYLMRYQLLKPKKYNSPKNWQTDNAPRLIYNNILPNNLQYKLVAAELCSILLYFEMEQKMLLVKVSGQYSNQLLNKYTTAYKLYQRARKTAKQNKSSKLFTVEQKQICNQEVNISLIKCYSGADNTIHKIVEVLSHSSSNVEKCIIIQVYDQQITQSIIDQFYDLKNNVNEKYIVMIACGILVDRSQTLQTTQITYESIMPCKWFQKHYKNTRKQKRVNKIKHYKQFLQIRYNITNYIQKYALNYISQNFVNDKYLNIALMKLEQIKNLIISNEKELIIKQQNLIKIIQQINNLKNSIELNKLDIININKNIQIIQKELIYLKNKQKYYIGYKQFKQLIKEIKQINRKQLQKNIINNIYLQQNSFNINYIFLFNIFADSQYFQGKSITIFQQQYKINNKYQLLQQQKKIFLKFITYGRLNSLIDNQQITIENDIINQEQINVCKKVRNQFIYLKDLIELVHENIIYSQQLPFSLNQLVKHQCLMINQKTSNHICGIFNKYIAYFFTHKYIVRHIIKKITLLEVELQDLRKKLKTIHLKNQNIENNLTTQYISQQKIKKQYQTNEKEIQGYRSNQKKFMTHLENNINMIGQMYLSISVGEFKCIYKYSQGNGSIQIDESQETLCELAQYMQQQLLKPIKRSMNNNQCQLLLFLMNQNAQKIIQQLPPMSLKKNYQYIFLNFANNLYKSINIQNKNILQEILKKQICYLYTCQELFIKQLYPDFKEEPFRILKKFKLMNAQILKLMNIFVQKIDYIQSKSQESINNFKLNQEQINRVLQTFRSSMRSINNGQDHLIFNEGEWSQKNKNNIQKCFQAIETIRKYVQKPQSHLRYYTELSSMICKKCGIQNLEVILLQLISDHSPKKIYDQQNCEAIQIPIQKKYHQSQQKNIKNCQVSTLGTMFLTQRSVILVNVGECQHIFEIIKSTCLDYKYQLIKHNRLQYYEIKNTSKVHCIVIWISLESDPETIKSQLRLLKYKINLNRIVNVHYVLLIQCKNMLKQLEKQQPIYHFEYRYSLQHIIQHEYRKCQLSLISTLISLMAYLCPYLPYVQLQAIMSCQISPQDITSIMVVYHHHCVHPNSIEAQLIPYIINKIKSSAQNIVQLPHAKDILKMKAILNSQQNEIALGTIRKIKEVHVVEGDYFNAKNDEEFNSLNHLMKKGEVEEFIDDLLMDPYIYLIINRSFKRVIDRMLLRRNANRNNKQLDHTYLAHLTVNYGLQSPINKLYQLFAKQCLKTGYRVDQFYLQLKKQNSEFKNQNSIIINFFGSLDIGNLFKTIFLGEIILNKQKKSDKLIPNHGILMHYHEPIVYQQRKNINFEIDEDSQANQVLTMQQIPQHREVIPIYQSQNYVLIGFLILYTHNVIPDHIIPYLLI